LGEEEQQNNNFKKVPCSAREKSFEIAYLWYELLTMYKVAAEQG
jgi:hypothetical protein